uniref:Uncharacterized protein n=1 Tax=Arundo donax TaxID=35708 RepID=A0A0A9AK99_ARUDO
MMRCLEHLILALCYYLLLRSCWKRKICHAHDVM